MSFTGIELGFDQLKFWICQNINVF